MDTDKSEGVNARAIDMNDDAVFSPIYEKMFSKVTKFIRGIVRNQEDAEDLAQATFLKARANNSFHDVSHLTAWLYTVAKTQALDFLDDKKRHEKIGEVSVDDAQSSIIDRCGASPNQDNIAGAMYLDRIMQQLSPEDRGMLAAHHGAGEKVTEIAEGSGISENNLKVQLHRARKKALKVARRLNAIGDVKAAADLVTAGRVDSATLPETQTCEQEIVLMYREGKSNKEIAHARGIEAGTVMSHLSHARNKGDLPLVRPLHLTKREYEVVTLERAGNTREEIASALSLALGVVNNYHRTASEKFPDRASLDAAIARKEAADSQPSSPIQNLSNREYDVIQLKRAGKRNTDIAEALGLAPGNIRVQLHSIRIKFPDPESLDAAITRKTAELNEMIARQRMSVRKTGRKSTDLTATL